jgi:pimeloyl-ACP methyl ester carboxylesterase
MQLNFRKYGDLGPSIIILHGFLGSLDNWLSIAKQLSKDNQVYLIDQRNHGKSPHNESMDYFVLANDLLDFTVQNKLKDIILIGHSMGGKVAMLFALQHPNLVHKLIVVDIAPIDYAGEHELILDAMDSLDLKKYNDRIGVESELKRKISSEVLLQFILKNLGRTDQNKFEWKINLPILIKNYRNLMVFPKQKLKFNGKTLFIKGENSDYIDLSNLKPIEGNFPKMEIKVIKGAGHWVQAEQPQLFLDVVNSFLKE